MGWPGHLAPLPSFINKPFPYILLVFSIGTVESFRTAVTNIFAECGNSDKSWELTAHLTKDVLDCWLDVSSEISDSDFQKFASDIISFNAERFRDELIVKAKNRQSLPSNGLSQLW